MILKESITNLLAHFAPLALIKQVFPSHKSCQVLTHTSHESKPWMNVDKVELTAEDFA